MKRKLFSVTIKDCEVSTFTVGGHGGSGKDTSNTGVLVVHPESGARGRATESRSQLENKRTAFGRMARSKEFTSWVKLVSSHDTKHREMVEKQVEEAMKPENLRIEYYDGDE